ncbi:hemicentin-1-like protein [Leptotrombidium deliense]|uniref:Hemicentin-1-like protein n=1 Tax=Leptotrombidium deliense TaxID=299467 RepID=A0A443RZS1_9ACAR|nr:hemicentin-1-like protein [Leptotrombidium deliense]
MKWIDEPKDVVFVTGKSAVVTCVADGYPNPTIQWLRNGVVASFKSDLSFNEIKPSDFGIYECVASNGAQSDLRKKVTIKVSEPPRIMRNIHASTLNEGSRFTALCTLTKGTEPLYFKWLKDTSTILPHSNDIKIQTLPMMSTLVIDAVQKHDSGNYTCIVNNDVGDDTYTIPLSVNIALKWIKQPKDTKAVVGKELVIECIAYGFPSPTIKWIKSGLKSVISNSEKLEFTNIGVSDAGEYECIVENGVDSELRKSVKVSVVVQNAALVLRE